MPFDLCILMWIGLHSPPVLSSESAISGYAQIDAYTARLSDGLGNWNDQNTRMHINTGTSYSYNAEISQQNHFDDRGIYYGLGVNRIFSESWYGSFAAGSSEGGFFLPRHRLDLSVSRKWTKTKSVITSLSAMYYKAKDIHSDRALQLSVIYYWDNPWIMEAGLRANESNPGSVWAYRQQATLSYALHKKQYWTLTFNTGEEAYQLIGQNAVVHNVYSSEGRILWRKWLARNYGLDTEAGYYSNKNYERSSFKLGVFYEF